jgi:TonB family protein
MRTLLLLAVLFSPAIVEPQQKLAAIADAVGTYPAMLHEKLASSCELVEPVTLIQYKGYAALGFPDVTREIYSPELSKDDFVTLSTSIPKEITKSARRSGFEVRVGKTDMDGSSSKPAIDGVACPDLGQAIENARARRDHRRTELQQHFYKLGFNVSPPVPVQQVQPQSAGKQAGSQLAPKTKVKQGKAVLLVAVGVDGKVHDSKVVRSFDVALDAKAIDALQQWKFLPARMNGLPVPVQIEVEINFRQY